MKKLISFAIMFMMAFVFLMGQNEKKALRKAQTHLDYDEYWQAIPYLEEALTYNPDNPETEYWLGLSLFKTHQKASAEKHLRKAYNMNPVVNEALPFYYAQALHYTLKFDEAIAMYEKAKQFLKPKDAEYQFIEDQVKAARFGKEMVKEPVDVEIDNLSGTVNTKYSDHSPLISADESILIFTHAGPESMGSSSDGTFMDEDIYISEKDDKGNWTKPRPLSSINSKKFDASVALSPDGQTLYIYKNPPGNGDMFMSKLQGTTWTEPEPLKGSINSNAAEVQMTISADGKRIFYVSDQSGGQGGLDIYMSTLKEDGTWSEGKNLGSQINTPKNEHGVFFHPNGKTLYFSSRGLPGMGGYDIFKTEMQENGSFTPPVNLGYPINTPDDDVFFTLSANGRHGYYSSAKEGGLGDKDIYMITMPQPKVDTTKVDTTEEEPVIVENALTILKGTVTDAVTADPLEASIQVIDNEKDEVIAEFHSNSATGKYLVSLPSGKNYGINVEKEGYAFHSENFNIPPATGYQEIIKDVELNKVEVGTKIVLRNIFFDHDKATLRPESKAELDRLYDFLTEFPKMKIEISGHTDNVGSDAYNQQLSEKRAKAVVEYLITKGINSQRLVAKGYGEARPLDTNETAEGRQNNRRTEFEILEN